MSRIAQIAGRTPQVANRRLGLPASAPLVPPPPPPPVLGDDEIAWLRAEHGDAAALVYLARIYGDTYQAPTPPSSPAGLPPINGSYYSHYGWRMRYIMSGDKGSNGERRKFSPGNKYLFQERQTDTIRIWTDLDALWEDGVENSMDLDFSQKFPYLVDSSSSSANVWWHWTEQWLMFLHETAIRRYDVDTDEDALFLDLGIGTLDLRTGKGDGIDIDTHRMLVTSNNISRACVIDLEAGQIVRTSDLKGQPGSYYRETEYAPIGSFYTPFNNLDYTFLLVGGQAVVEVRETGGTWLLDLAGRPIGQITETANHTESGLYLINGVKKPGVIVSASAGNTKPGTSLQNAKKGEDYIFVLDWSVDPATGQYQLSRQIYLIKPFPAPENRSQANAGQWSAHPRLGVALKGLQNSAIIYNEPSNVQEPWLDHYLECSLDAADTDVRLIDHTRIATNYVPLQAEIWGSEENPDGSYYALVRSSLGTNSNYNFLVKMPRRSSLADRANALMGILP